VTPLPERLCAVALGSGHAEFWADDDGIVRRLDLLVNASGTLVPSAALRAALAVSFPSGAPPALAGQDLRWDDNAITTSDGIATLLRFYGPTAAGRAFRTLTAEAVLRGSDAARPVAGRIVVLGSLDAGSGDAAYATPQDERTPPAELLAIGLSNLTKGDYVTRPGWLRWAEHAVLVLVGLAALLFGARLPRAAGVAAGAGVAVLLLGAEAVALLQAGVWAQLTTAAAFAACAVPAVRLMQPGAVPLEVGPALAAAHAGGRTTGPADGLAAAEDELDLAFSMLRHQTPSESVKGRLYDIALEHARRRDLAKAERVLRHLAGIDPDYRNAGDKLKKLAGLRSAAAQPAHPLPAAAASPAVAESSATGNLTGRAIGRYQVEQPIGRGAMATVYLGRDPKINRRVAIKTIALAEEFTDEDLVNARTQFLREAESSGRLNHPSIITIYDAGEDGQVAYLAMEYFPGKPLSHYAQQGQLLPARLVFELMARAAEALHYAHGQHVVHRDVKPANIMYDRSTDTLKITDFGIARLTDTSRTKTGIILGTPSYMSPEQLAGTNVTGASDLFSLGITLYQLLTGMPPFRADSIPKLMQKIAHERHESVRALRDDLPPCVDELFDRALAKDPADRFPSGRAMALALRECCSRLTTSPAAQSP
jgi:serine/threonine-protein kinase